MGGSSLSIRFAATTAALVWLALASPAMPAAAGAATPGAASADALVRAAFDNWRARSSVSEIVMTVHRPDWQRTLDLKAWTRGDDDALVRFVSPAKDAGNATLKLGAATWMFNPKLNQVIRLPTSMMAQSWMGSDFSYNDLSRADDLLTQYTHRIVAQQQSDHAVYTIEAIPKPGAPVVWGKLVVTVRDDGVILGETYFDQDMRVVRAMVTDKVGPIGGREYPLVMSMHPAQAPQQWTRIETRAATFNGALPAYLFTLSNLQNPRH